MSTHRSIVLKAVPKAGLLAAALLSGGYTAADDTPGDWQPSDEQRARMEARFETMRDRLDLSEEQAAKLESILQEDIATRAEVLQRHGVTRDKEDRPGRREMQAMRRELRAVSEATDAAIERILDERQLQEYRNLKEEARDEVRERMRSRRQESPTGE